MGIQLDWQMDAGKGRSRQHPEDPQERRARYVGLLRLLLVIVLLLAIIGLVVYLVARRLEQVNSRVEQLLRDTVAAEVAALRIGDAATFLEIQRSATDDWRLAQQALFSLMQARKQTSDIRLTGRIADLEIDGPRARVQVEEIENGVPYLRTWFYWRYDDSGSGDDLLPGGWYHVPPDYTFWGAAATLERDRFSIRYRAVDALLAQQMADVVAMWLEQVCQALPCAALPPITVDIVPVPLPEPAWSDAGSAWQLVLPSPYMDRARADAPFDTPQRIAMGTLLATRLTDSLIAERQPIYPADAHYVRSSVIAWLVGRFVQVGSSTYLLDSLAQQYGTARLGQLVQALQPDSSISLLSSVTGVPNLAQMPLDWRDFFTWRLATEDDLILRRDEPRWLSLLDVRSEADRAAAYARYNSSTPPEPKIATAVLPQMAADGTPQVRVTVRVGANTIYREEYVLFNLVDNVWRRAG